MIKNNKKGANFISELTKVISNINTSHIMDKDSLETTIQEYARLSEFIWLKHSHSVNITKCSKEW